MQQDPLTLDNSRKSQLDSNIKKMLEGGASNDDVMSYASDFKNKFGVKKKDDSQLVSTIGSEPLPIGSKPFQTQVPTEAPSVLTPKGQVDYQEQVKDFKPAIQKPISKPKTLSEAVSNDDNYIGAIWNRIPDRLASFIGGASKIVGKSIVSNELSTLIKSGFDIGKYMTGSEKSNIARDILSKKNIEEIGQSAEGFIKKTKTTSASSDYEKEILSGFDVSDGLDVKDAKAIPLMLSGMLADVGLAIPSFGLSYFAQGYNDGVGEYDEAIKESGIEANDDVRDLFGITYGSINGLADKLGLDFITKSKPVSETVKKYILKEAVKELAKKEAKNITSNVIESTIANIAKSTFNKVKAVGVKTAIGAVGEGVTEPIQGGLSDGLKVITNKLSGSDVFDIEDIRKNFWKSRINDAAGGVVMGGTLGGALNALKSSDSYIAERVAESTTPEQIQLLKEELVNSVDDNGNPLLDEEKINILNSAIDKYSEANQKLPAGLSTEKRAKALQLISERDEIKASRDAAIQNIDNVDEAIKPEMEGDMVIFENKEQQKNDEIREAVTGSKYKYFQDEDGKFYKKLGDGKAEEISQEYFNLQNQDTEIGDQLTKKETDAVQVETTGQVPVQPEAPVSEEVEQGKPEAEPKVVTEEGKEEVTPAQKVEQLRAAEQAELKAAIPNADQYLTDGKVDEKKLTNDKDKEAFNEIWERYNVLITPNLPKEVVKTEEVNPIIESIANLKLDENNLESVIEELEFIDDAKRKAARSSTSSKTKAKLNADIAQYEANIADKPNEVKIAKTINDNFDKIKKDLKEQGLLNVKC
jgi:hypothetical protein